MKGTPEEAEVARKCGILHIVYVETRLNGFDHGLIELVDLGAGDLEEHAFFVAKGEGSLSGEAGAVGHTESFMVSQLWARADEAHVTLEDVPELGQLVHFVAAQEGAGGRDAGVAEDRVARTAGETVSAHGTEFEEGEFFAITAGAELTKEGGATRAEADEDPAKGHQWRENQKRDSGHGEVEEAACARVDPWAGRRNVGVPVPRFIAFRVRLRKYANEGSTNEQGEVGESHFPEQIRAHKGSPPARLKKPAVQSSPFSWG
jgi:hypothetical protein